MTPKRTSFVNLKKLLNRPTGEETNRKRNRTKSKKEREKMNASLDVTTFLRYKKGVTDVLTNRGFGHQTKGVTDR